MRHPQVIPDNAAANRLIDNGESISALGRVLAGRGDAIAYYAAYQARRHPPVNPSTGCCVCEKPARPAVSVACVWRAYHGSALSPRWSDALFLLAGVVSISTRYQRIDFCTGHVMCRGCYRSLKRKRALANVLQFVAMFVGLITLTAIPIAIGIAVMTWRTPRERLGSLVAISVTIAFFAAACAMYWPIMRLRLPASLRGIGRRPFRSHSMTGVGA